MRTVDSGDKRAARRLADERPPAAVSNRRLAVEIEDDYLIDAYRGFQDRAVIAGEFPIDSIIKLDHDPRP
jgi:hypothetical protein